ncbi:MAG: hypothetical protein JNM93_04655 [Bacteriovoracaceae bacterium]|nr:hypothetical protein [Bacteriovoracaceae bacterium]
MKSLLLSLIASLLVSQVALAQKTSPKPKSAMPSFFGHYPIAVESGGYNFQTMDNTVVAEYVMKQFDEVRKEDLVFLNNAITKLNSNYATLVELFYNKQDGLKTISANAYSCVNAKNPLTPPQFLELKNKYEETELNYSNTLATIDAIPNAMMSSVKGHAGLTENKAKELRANFEKISLEGVKTYYQGELAKLKKEAETTKACIKFPSGAEYQQVGLFDLTKFNEFKPYGAVDINAKRKQRDQLRASNQTAADRTFDSTINPLTRKMIDAVITEFGKKASKYRFNPNTDGKSAAVKDLERIFFVRSALRNLYGMQLGTLDIDYKYITANIDQLMNSSIKFTGIISRKLVDKASDGVDHGLIALEDRIFNALKTMSFKNKDFMASGVSTFSRLSSIVTWMRGKNTEVSINEPVLAMMLADVQEELMLAAGRNGGRAGVQESYEARYKINANWSNEIEYYFLAQMEGRNEPEHDNQDPNTIMGAKNNAMRALDDREAFFTQARELDIMIKNLEDPANTAKKKSRL